MVFNPLPFYFPSYNFVFNKKITPAFKLSLILHASLYCFYNKQNDIYKMIFFTMQILTLALIINY